MGTFFKELFLVFFVIQDIWGLSIFLQTGRKDNAN